MCWTFYTAEWGKAEQELHSCPDMTAERGGKARSGCSFKAHWHESFWETTACFSALISPLTSYRRPKQSFHCCGEGRTFIFPLGVSWGCTMGSLQDCGMTPDEHKANSEYATGCLLAGWVAPLSPAYRPDEAIYSSMHYGMKCTTRLQWPTKDKGCHIFWRLHRSGVLCSVIVALRSCGQLRQKGNCLVGWQ